MTDQRTEHVKADEVLVVMGAGHSWDDVQAAERFVAERTGRKPYSWCDGRGVWTVGPSDNPAVPTTA